MKTYKFFALLLLTGLLSQAQVGIGTLQPHSSAILEINELGNHKGVLIPRITDAEKNSILNPATGLLIYQTDSTQGFYYYSGVEWSHLGGVRTINGASPSNNGNVVLNLLATQTGSQSDRINSTNLEDGLIHIVIGDNDPNENGKVYIYSTSLNQWTLTTNFTDTDTDNQNIIGSSFDSSTNNLTIGIEGGSGQTIDLSSLGVASTTDSQTISASLDGVTLNLLPENTTTTVTVNLGSLTTTPSLEQVTTVGGSTTNSLTIGDLIPFDNTKNLGDTSNTWNTLYVSSILSDNISSTSVTATQLSVSEYLRHEADYDTYLQFNPDQINLFTGNVDGLKITPSLIEFNEGEAPLDFNVRSAGNQNMFHIDGTNDYIGIGTATPTSELEVSGIISATGIIDGSLGNQNELIFVGANKRLSSSASMTVDPVNGNLIISGTLSATNIDISGTITTTSDLFVSGNTRLEGDLTTTDADITFEDLNNTYPTNGKGFFWRLNNDTAKIYARQPSSDAIDFYFNLADNTNGTADRYIFWHRHYGPDLNDDRFPLVMNSSSFYVYANPSGTEAVPDLSGWAMKVDRGGDVNISDDLTVAGSGTVGGSAITSDLRLKSNIIEAAFGLKEILALKPKMYDKFKSTKKENLVGKEIGFIAQEVMKVIPYIVNETDSENKLLSLNYNALIPILAKAIQEQHQNNLETKARLNELEAENIELKKDVAHIKKLIKSLYP